MSAAEIIEEIKKLPQEDKEEVFAYLTQDVVGSYGRAEKRWLGKKLNFDEACEAVFRENRELLGLLAK